MKLIVISSGKGGVGKTTVSFELAKHFSENGRSVGLVDTDIDTPNLPDFIEGETPVFEVNDKIEPVIIHGIEMASMGFMVGKSECISWNGLTRISAINDLLCNVNWTCDYLIVDTSPGTSEEMKYILEIHKPEFVYIVSTPHQASITDVRRTISLMRILKSNLNGIIMNMSKFECTKCGELSDVFGNSDDIESIDNVDVIAYLPLMHDHSSTDTKDAFVDGMDTVFHSIING